MTGPRVLPEYYGPDASDIAGAFERNEQRKRQKAYDARAASHEELWESGEKGRQQREADEAPLEHALRLANMRKSGIHLPGETDQAAPGPTQSLPPASPTPGRPDLGGAPTGNPGQRSAPLSAESGGQQPAHMLPGAFNPATNAHNPADINLGGGFSLPYSETSEGKQSSDYSALSHANVPGVTPELALYLSHHPEHMAPFFERAYSRTGWHPGSEAESLDYEDKLAQIHSRYPAHESTKPDITLAGALEQVDQMYGNTDPATGQVHSRLNPAARLRTARDIEHGDFSHLGPSANFGSRGNDLTYEQALAGRGIKGVEPRSDEEKDQDAAGQRATQIKQIRTMIPKGASPNRVRAILKKHGLTPQEIEQVVGGGR